MLDVNVMMVGLMIVVISAEHRFLVPNFLCPLSVARVALSTHGKEARLFVG